MILHPRSVAVSAAVLCFFAVGIVGSLRGLTPATCGQRAFLAAAVMYLVTGAALRAINAIMTQAMIESQLRKENLSDHEG
jgi:uncharacterized membrane protein YjjP (DUF1212 family)